MPQQQNDDDAGGGRSVDDIEGEATAKKVFGLFVETLIGERDLADDHLLVKLRWYSDDVAKAVERLGEDPRAARRLLHHLSGVVAELERSSTSIDTMQENLHQARRWALLLPDGGICE